MVSPGSDAMSSSDGVEDALQQAVEAKRSKTRQKGKAEPTSLSSLFPLVGLSPP